MTSSAVPNSPGLFFSSSFAAKCLCVKTFAKPPTSHSLFLHILYPLFPFEAGVPFLYYERINFIKCHSIKKHSKQFTKRSPTRAYKNNFLKLAMDRLHFTLCRARLLSFYFRKIFRNPADLKIIQQCIH